MLSLQKTVCNKKVFCRPIKIMLRGAATWVIFLCYLANLTESRHIATVARSLQAKIAQLETTMERYRDEIRKSTNQLKSIKSAITINNYDAIEKQVDDILTMNDNLLIKWYEASEEQAKLNRILQNMCIHYVNEINRQGWQGSKLPFQINRNACGQFDTT